MSGLINFVKFLHVGIHKCSWRINLQTYFSPNMLGVLMWEERGGWKKTEGGTEVMMTSLSLFWTHDHSHPNHVSRRCKPQRICDKIAAIPWCIWWFIAWRHQVLSHVPLYRCWLACIGTEFAWDKWNGQFCVEIRSYFSLEKNYYSGYRYNEKELFL